MSIFDQLRTEQFQQVIDQANAAQLRVLWQAEKAKVVQLKELVKELSSNLEYEIGARYDGMLHYPTMMSSYNSDMDVVNRAKEILGEM